MSRRSVPEMLSDALREVAVLLLVFIPLDLWITQESLTILEILGTFAFASGFWWLGVWAERLRDVHDD